MYRKKECVAMLLAGGQGSRLYALTEKTAKPAVPFGGKYRIIDFPMSNCVNSRIDTVGVLTQYQPLALNEYIGNGEPWDLDKTQGGVRVLPPYQGKSSSDWYKGTANAIYQNLNFIERYKAEYVLILSGDHIYKMDYDKMLKSHKANKADCTIAVLEVPMDQASRFGILSTDENNLITEFEEKPKQPKSNKASMGIYIFSADVLKKYLVEDEMNPNSSNDFGKDVIPKMLNDGMKMYAYTFEGYWKDVGTIKSYWEANMELIGSNPVFNIYDKSWRIFCRHTPEPPQKISAGAVVKNSMITEGCKIKGTVINSVISESVTVEKGAIVKDSVILRDTVIKANAVIDHAIIDENVTVGEGAKVGDEATYNGEITVVAGGTIVKDGVSIPSGFMVNRTDSQYVTEKKEG